MGSSISHLMVILFVTNRAILFRQILPGLEPLLRSLKEIAQKRSKTVPQVMFDFYFMFMKNSVIFLWPRLPMGAPLTLLSGADGQI